MPGREKTLPDISLIQGRLLVPNWDEGLEGVEDALAEAQLRRLIPSLVTYWHSWQEYDLMMNLKKDSLDEE